MPRLVFTPIATLLAVNTKHALESVSQFMLDSAVGSSSSSYSCVRRYFMQMGKWMAAANSKVSIYHMFHIIWVYAAREHQMSECSIGHSNAFSVCRVQRWSLFNVSSLLKYALRVGCHEVALAVSTNWWLLSFAQTNEYEYAGSFRNQVNKYISLEYFFHFLLFSKE